MLSFCVQVCWPRTCRRPGHWKQESPSSGAEAFPRHCLQPGRLQRPLLNLSTKKKKTQTPHSPGNQIHYAKPFYSIKNSDRVYPMCSGLQNALSVIESLSPAWIHYFFFYILLISSLRHRCCPAQQLQIMINRRKFRFSLSITAQMLNGLNVFSTKAQLQSRYRYNNHVCCLLTHYLEIFPQTFESRVVGIPIFNGYLTLICMFVFSLLIIVG